MSEGDFYAAATLGFRSWKLVLETSELCSVGAFYDKDGHLRMWRPFLSKTQWGRYFVWEPDKVVEATCPFLNHDAPQADCECGIPALAYRPNAAPEGIVFPDLEGPPTDITLVTGIIAGWGGNENHAGPDGPDGFRCKRAKILAFFRPPDHDRVDERAVTSLEAFCEGHDVPLLENAALRSEPEVRRYARERELLLLEDLVY
jgi:hypothetical protein